MSGIPSFTVNTSILQLSLNAKTDELNKGKSAKPLKPDLTDLVTVSRQGIEKQQQANQLEASKQIEDIANDAIRVTSSIGKARSVGGLTNSQATELYNEIAKLL